MEPQLPSQIDHNARNAAQIRREKLAVGLAALPNLFLRSTMTLVFLYGLLTLLLITIVQFGYLTPGLAVGIGVAVALLQFALGPWIVDLMLRSLFTMRWVKPDDLPDHLRSFVAGVCQKHRMRFPSFGIIDDGAPVAYTYGHHPSNARVVISRGLMEMLSPGELEAVVAHELGHARNWDMALMTLANLVPLIMFLIYNLAFRMTNLLGRKNRAPAWIIGLGAYVLYVVSEFIVLWFSRTREFHADRFAGEETGDPNALGRALVKIAYGLAAQGTKPGEKREGEDMGAEKKEEKGAYVGAGAWGALNIADRRASLTLVMGLGDVGNSAGALDEERVKSAMQYD